MIRRIVSAFGLGVVGADPITAFYILSMGLRKEKKINITSFMFSFVFFSIVPGAVLSVLFGTKAVDWIKSILPGDESPFWAYLEFAVSLAILIWLIKRFIKKEKKQPDKKSTINSSAIKCAVTGFGFAIAAYTDPTYYAVMLLGGESGDFLSAVILLAIWLFISQSPAMIVYGAVELNCLDKLGELVDKAKNSKLKRAKVVFYILLMMISVLLIVDSGFYLFGGNYLF